MPADGDVLAAARAHRSWKARLAAATGAVTLAALAAATPAGAHAQLVKADPARDAVVAAAPERVTLSFNEAVSTVGTTLISVVAPDGTDVTAGPVVVKDAEVSVPLLPLAVSGAYTVTYRVVSDDGHIVNDSYSFIYQPPSAATSAPDTSGQPTDPALGADAGTAPGTVARSGGGLHLSVGKIATIAVFAAVYLLVARWMKAYRRRSLGR